MPEALLLDLGKVLVGFDHMDTCRALAPETGLEPAEVYRRLFASGVEARFDRGELGEDEFGSLACERLGLPGARAPRVLAAWADIFHRDEANLALLEPLAARYRLVLVSNTNRTHMRRVEELAPELRHFHARALSFELGVAKPDPGHYLAAVAAAGVPAAACLFVDDRAENVEAAAALGIPAHAHEPGAALAHTLGPAITG